MASERYNGFYDKLKFMYFASGGGNGDFEYDFYSDRSAIYNIHTLKFYFHFLPTKVIILEEIIEIKQRKRNYKKIMPDLIRINRVLCFDLVYVIKDFLILTQANKNKAQFVISIVKNPFNLSF